MRGSLSGLRQSPLDTCPEVAGATSPQCQPTTHTKEMDSCSPRVSYSFHRLTVPVQFRQRLDPLPSLASVHSLDTDLIEVVVKHGGTLFCQGRCAVIFFLPYRNSVRLVT